MQGWVTNIDRSPNFCYACSPLSSGEQRLTSVFVPLIVSFPSNMVVEDVGDIVGDLDWVFTTEFVLEARSLICPMLEVEIWAVGGILLVWSPGMIAEI